MSSESKRILIVRLGGIGDVICTLPAVEAIRAAFPNAFIGYAVEEPSFDLVHGHPAINKVHLFRRRHFARQVKSLDKWPRIMAEISAYRRELRGKQYDLALDFQRNFKGAMHTLASHASRKVGFSKPTAREFNHWFYREHVNPSPAVHWVDKFLAMAGSIGGKISEAQYRLPDAPASAARVLQFLTQNKIDRFIAMHAATSSFDLERRWKPERFGQLAQRIGAIGMTTVVTWGPGEQDIAQSVVRESDGHAILAFESKSLLDLAELYRKAQIYVGLDTGPMHLATAVGLPSVVLFGSGNPSAYGPRSAGSQIIANYKGALIKPMSSITVDQVMKAVEKVLATL